MANQLLKELNFKKHTSIESSIPIEEVFVEPNGLLKSINNKYTLSFRLEDPNFLLVDNDEQRNILNDYKAMLNSLDETIGFQFSILNSKLSDTYMEDNVYYKYTGDKFDYLRKALNDNIKKNIIDDNKAFSKEKVITISFEHKNFDKVVKEMKIIEDVVKEGIENIEGSKLELLGASELLQYINSIYNLFHKNDYVCRAKFLNKDVEIFTLDNAIKQGCSAKELVQPSSMEFHNDYIKFGDMYLRAIYLKEMNRQINVETLNKLCSQDFELLLTCKLNQIEIDEAVRAVRMNLINIEGQIADSQKKLGQEGISADLISSKLKQGREEAQDLYDSIFIRDERIFEESVYVLVFADSLDTLKENTDKFMKIAKGKGLMFRIGELIQEEIFNSCLPYGLNQTSFNRYVDTEGALALNPFGSQDLMQPNGDYFGKNKLTNNPIMYNIMSGDNYSSLLLGESGKGKSFLTKLLSSGRVLKNLNRDIIIIDPQNEYGDVVRQLDGEVINISAGGDNHINMFDIDINYGNNPIADKQDFILLIMSQMVHNYTGLSAMQRNLVSKAISNIYKKWEYEKKEENVPTIEDFYKYIKEHAINEEQKELLEAIEFYCSEDSNVTLFKGKTDVDLNNKLIVFNLLDLGADFKPLAMQVLLDNIWTKICKNRKRGIPTDVIIDEFHLMFLLDNTAEWMKKFWKTLRKFLGCPMGITQDPEDMLSNINGRAIVQNSSTIMMLSLKPRNLEIVKNELSLTDKQCEYINKKPSGEGLLFVQANRKLKDNHIIPFSNQFSHDNEIYKLINTTYLKSEE